MNKFIKPIILILQTLFLYILLLTSSSISLEKFYKGDTVSNYFDIYMNGLEPERYYEILLKVNHNNQVKIIN